MASTNPKLNSSLKSILYNQWILYFISFLAVVDFIALCGMKDWFSVVVFASVGFLVTFFNKNMLVVLSIAMAVTHILKYGIQHSRVHEGFEDSEENTSNEEEEDVQNIEKEETPDDMKKNTGKDTGKSTGKDTGKEEKKTKMSKFMELKKDFPEFKEIQKQILDGVDKMNPLLSKAENFIEKFNDYKTS